MEVPAPYVKLFDDWRLKCSFTDTVLVITVFKLGLQSKFVTEFKSVPEKFQIFAETFAELK